MNSNDVLETYFPYIESLRKEQQDAIGILLEGKNTLCLLPTGYGKSLIYQVAGLSLKKTTVVISPLVALMRQQQQQLHEKGLQAINFSGMSSIDQFKALNRMAREGLPQFVFTSPERLSNDGFFEYVLNKRKDDIGLVVVDEVHCVSQWGEGFRPAYRNIPLALDRIFGHDWPTVLCLTATLNQAQQEEVTRDFRISSVVRGENMRRPELVLEKRVLGDGRESRKDEELERILNEHRGEKVLVFVHRKYGNKGTTRTLYEKYKNSYSGVAYFDSEMDDKEKDDVLSGFGDGSVKIVFATSAFGMGVDIPDIRVVVNYLVSETVEQYYQEVGRAGRDRQRAWGYLLYTNQSRKGRIQLLGRTLYSRKGIESEWDDRRPKRGATFGHVNYETMTDEQRTAFALLIDYGVFEIVAKGVQSLDCFQGTTAEGKTFLSELGGYSKTGLVSIIAKKSGRDIASLTNEIWRCCAEGDIRLVRAPSRAIFYRLGQELTDEITEQIVADQEAKKRSRRKAFESFADGIENESKSMQDLVDEALGF